MNIQDLAQCARMDWAKTRARWDRWQEELLLNQEEMCRTIAYLEWEAKAWNKGLPKDTAIFNFVTEPADTEIYREGIAAYTNKQVEQREALANHFLQTWRVCLDYHDCQEPAEWARHVSTEKNVATQMKWKKGKRQREEHAEAAKEYVIMQANTIDPMEQLLQHHYHMVETLYLLFSNNRLVEVQNRPSRPSAIVRSTGNRFP